MKGNVVAVHLQATLDIHELVKDGDESLCNDWVNLKISRAQASAVVLADEHHQDVQRKEGIYDRLLHAIHRVLDMERHGLNEIICFTEIVKNDVAGLQDIAVGEDIAVELRVRKVHLLFVVWSIGADSTLEVVNIAVESISRSCLVGIVELTLDANNTLQSIFGISDDVSGSAWLERIHVRVE